MGDERTEFVSDDGTVTVTEVSGTTTTTTRTKPCGCTTKWWYSTGPWGGSGLSGGSCFRHAYRSYLAGGASHG